MRDKISLSIIIPVYNSEKYLDNLLKELSKWRIDEIIICDSFSTDDTLKIASKWKVSIIQHEYINSAKQKNWAIPQAKNEWVLIIDSDEIPDENLIPEIIDFIQKKSHLFDLAYIPRKNLFWGKFMNKTSSFPDYQSRLFKRDKGRYQNKEVHAQVEVNGKSTRLKSSLIHDDFKTIDIWWERNKRYYNYELDEFLKTNTSWSIKLQYIKPIYIFFLIYIIRGGFKHGFRGFFVAFQWMIYHFFCAAKLYEKTKI